MRQQHPQHFQGGMGLKEKGNSQNQRVKKIPRKYILGSRSSRNSQNSSSDAETAEMPHRRALTVRKMLLN